MKPLNDLQKHLLEIAPLNETIQVTTSTWTIYTDTFKPRCYCTHASLKSLERQGYISARYYWRGADVIRIK